MTDGAAHWIWLRHAPARTAGRFCGVTDPALDDSLVFDYAAVAGALPNGARTFVSPRLRADRTLENLIQAGFEPGETTITALVGEQDFGCCEDRPYADVTLPEGAEALASWQPDGGESFAMVVERVREFMHQDIAGDACIIAHAGAIRAALAVALDIPAARALAFSIDYLSRTAFTRFAGGPWQVSYVNQGVNRTGAD